MTVCLAEGFAFQSDMKVTAKYDEDYWEKYVGYEGQEIAEQINEGRIALVARHAGPDERVCDIGIGSGEFIKRRGNTWGTDVNPLALLWLSGQGLLASDLSDFHAVTMWDVIEHCPEPGIYLDRIPIGGWLFTSVPIVDLSDVRASRHYRPGEHLLYFTVSGFERWMALHGFTLREHTDFEMKAGRDSIHSFAFQRMHG